MKVLIIEDDPILGKNISEALHAEQIAAEMVYDGMLAERMLRNNVYDCVVMDINLPGKNGYDLCKSFRKFNTETPVLMLTAFSVLDDKIKGFESGADDYLTKPFYMRELLVRIHSLVKRSLPSKTDKSDKEEWIIDDLMIMLPQKKVFRQGKEIVLTPREYQLLYKLAEKPGEIVSKQELVQTIWGNALDVNTNTIEVYINFLRNKIDKPFGRNTLKTKIGFGYYLDIL